MNALNWYLLALALTTTPAAWASVYVHSRTPWTATAVGRHLMAYMVALALTFTALTVGVLSNYDLPVWLEYGRAVAYTGTPVVVIWRLVLQLQARRHPLTEPRTRGRHRNSQDRRD